MSAEAFPVPPLPTTGRHYSEAGLLPTIAKPEVVPSHARQKHSRCRSLPTTGRHYSEAGLLPTIAKPEMVPSHAPQRHSR